MGIISQGNLFMADTGGYSVAPIPKNQLEQFLLHYHYAKRMPPVRYAFGLFSDGELVGVCTFGVPPSHTLIKGVCGEDYAPYVLELNRLCLLNNKPNEASRLVAGSLRHLGDRIVVSFADTAQDHVGFVYQATNALYTGKTEPFKEIYVIGQEHLHHATHRGMTYQDMLEKYGGENIGFRERSIKHRYVYILGSKSFKRAARAALNYTVSDYPKHN